MVVTATDDAFSVGAPDHAVDPPREALGQGLLASLPVRVPLEGQGLLAGDRVPHLHRPVRIVGARGDAFAVGAPGDAVDPTRVTPEGQGFLARSRVPELHGVTTVAGNVCVVGAAGGSHGHANLATLSCRSVRRVGLH